MKEAKKKELEKKKLEQKEKEAEEKKRENSVKKQEALLGSPRGKRTVTLAESTKVSSSMDLTQACLSCHAPLKLGSKFCTKCGNKQDATSTSQTAETLKQQSERTKKMKEEAEETLKKEKARLEAAKKKELEEAKKKSQEKRQERLEQAKLRVSRRKISSINPTASTTSQQFISIYYLSFFGQ